MMCYNRFDRRCQNERGVSSAIEYMAMITFILMAFFISQHFIMKGFAGRWKAAGDAFGHGKQYDPRDSTKGGSVECFFDAKKSLWISTRCFKSKCVTGIPSDPDCQQFLDPCSELQSANSKCGD